MEKKSYKRVTFLSLILWGIIITGLYLASLYNFLLFHTIVEIFSVFIAYGIFVVAWNSREYTDNPFFLFLGIGYFFIGSFDLLHTLSYKGMGIFLGFDCNLPTQLWVAARYLESLTLFGALVLSKRRVSVTKLLSAYLFITILFCLSIFYFKNFPDCFVEGTGLTPFKITSELIISSFLVGSVIIFVRNKNDYDKNIFKMIIASIVLTIASELCFIFYISVYGISNLAGHWFKILSFFFIYKAIIETTLTMPRTEMFKALMLSEKALKKKEIVLKDILNSLRDGKQFLNNVLESLTHPFYVIDAKNYEIVLANKAAFNTYGRDEKTCYALTHGRQTPCDSAEHPCPLHEIKKTKSPIICEHIHYDKDNDKRIIEVHGFPLLDDQGNVTQMIEYSFDVTRKKQLEGKLVDAHAFQKKIIDQSPVGIIIYNEKGDCISSNSSAGDMIGATEDQIRQINFHSLETWKKSGLYDGVLNALAEKITIKIDFSGLTVFGKKTDLEYIFIPFGENQLMLMLNDISDRKKIEKELKKEMEFNLALADLSKKVISAKNIEEVSIFVLEQAKYFTKSPMGYAGYIDEETGHLITPTLMEDVWDKCQVQDKSYKFTNFVGLWGWVLDNKKPLYLNTIEDDPRSTGVPKGHVPINRFLSIPALMDGLLLGQICLINSSEKYTDEDIKILERIANLYSIAIHQKRMLKALGESKKAADAANLAKSNFLSNMSHEIRTPMNSILGFSELLRNMLSEPKQKSYLDSIYSSGEVLLNIINDILDLSKIEAGKLTLNTDLVSPHVLFKETHQLFFAQASQKGVDFIFEISPDIPDHLFLDEFRLKQVLGNLISNALKFTDEGFIKICAKPVQNKNTTIDLSISVEDTGIGITSEFMEKIFEPFSQKEGQDSRKYGGTGLGLSITEHLVEMMGGQIFVDSRISKGSTFTILLKQVEIEPKLSMGKPSVLIADDHGPPHKKVTGLAISKEMLSRIPLIIDSLETSLMEKWESITDNHHLPDIEDFAKRVKKLGQKHQITHLIEYGDTLFLHANNFDIERIQEHLEAYPNLVKQLKKLSGKESA